MPDTNLQFVPGIQGPVVFNASPAPDANNCKQIIGAPSAFCVRAPVTR